MRQGVEQFAVRYINLLIQFGIRSDCVMSGKCRSLYSFIRKAIKQILILLDAYQFCQQGTKFYPKSSVKVYSFCRRNYWGSSVWISTQQVNYCHIFCIRQIPEKKWEYNEAVHQLFIDFKKAYDSVRREVL